MKQIKKTAKERKWDEKDTHDMEKRRQFESEIELPKKLEAKLVKPRSNFETK